MARLQEMRKNIEKKHMRISNKHGFNNQKLWGKWVWTISNCELNRDSTIQNGQEIVFFPWTMVISLIWLWKLMRFNLCWPMNGKFGCAWKEGLAPIPKLPWGSLGSYACIHGWMYTDVYGCIRYLIGGWPTYPSEKNDFVSWDDDIPNWMEKIQFMFQTTNQVYTGYEWLWPTVFICFLSAGSASGQNYLIICWGFNPNQWRPVSSCPEVHLKFHMALAQPNLDLLNPCHRLEHMLSRFWFVDCRGSLQQIQEMSGSSHEKPPFIVDFPMIFPWSCHDFPRVLPWFSHGFPIESTIRDTYVFLSPHTGLDRGSRRHWGTWVQAWNGDIGMAEESNSREELEIWRIIPHVCEKTWKQYM